jgi:hypothetical protein
MAESKVKVTQLINSQGMGRTPRDDMYVTLTLRP